MDNRHPQGQLERVGSAILGMSCMLVLPTAIGFLFCLGAIRWGSRSHSDYGLIISPIGLALIQRSSRGEMVWDELRKVIFPLRSRSFHGQRLSIPGIGLKVEGAMIGIGDFYDRPLSMIYGRIMAYWKAPGVIED